LGGEAPHVKHVRAASRETFSVSQIRSITSHRSGDASLYMISSTNDISGSKEAGPEATGPAVVERNSAFDLDT
jgi:hypothetical protein